MRYLLFFVLALSMTGCANVALHRQSPPSTVVTTQAPPPVVSPAPVMTPTAAPVPPPITMPYTQADVQCMAHAMYFEARGEGDRGMEAVGYAIRNRVRNKQHYPPSICKVVYQGPRDRRGRLRTNRCQFSWACAGHTYRVTDRKTFEHCQDMAKLVILGVAPNPIGRRTSFDSITHYNRVRHRHYANVLRVGHQIFYLPKGEEIALAAVSP